MKPYICVGMILYNEERMIRYSVGSVYDYVDQFVIVDHNSTDKTCDILKELDKDKKIVILKRKWDNSYKNARNTYLDYIKKNIYPKNRTNSYYLRIDADEVYHDDWIANIKNFIEENPDKEGFRGNFYSFTADYNSLDEVHPTETRVSLFKYTPDIVYANDLHEMPVHGNGRPLYGSPFEDSRLGIVYVPGYQYNHYAWCDVDRCVVKAKNYTEHYVKQGTETKERLDTITASKDSWWWDKKSSIKYKAKLPSVFSKYGFLPGQEDPEVTNDRPKISAYTIIKNAIKYDYPIVEAARSVLGIADELIIVVGNPYPGEQDDGTLGLVRKAFEGFEKVKIYTEDWESREAGTAFLRNASNRALSRTSNPICLYLQADEVYSEEDAGKIIDAAKVLYERKDLAGAIFKWRHFDGLPTYINKESYPEEVRLIRKEFCESIGDAQSMGFKPANLTNVRAFPQFLLDTDIRVYHYGWLREPEKMLAKLRSFDKFYHNDEEWNEMHKNDETRYKDGKYDYGEKKENFFEPHPHIMFPRIRKYERENGLGEKAVFNR